MLPLPGWNRAPVLTWVLLAGNLGIWLAESNAGGSNDRGVLLGFGAMFGPLIADGEYWRLFTAMFLHAGIEHLALNCLALFIFGRLVEMAYGHVRFLTIYILAGLAGSVASYLLNTIAIGVGASGAIFGVLGALAAYFVVQKKVFGKMGQRDLTGVLFLAAINLLYGLTSPGIDNWAHMGGFAAGFGLGLVLAPKYRLVTDPVGTSTALVDANSLARRWWIVPASLVVVWVGSLLATANLPDNAYSHVYEAERYHSQQNYDMALEEIDRAFRLDFSVAEAHLLRARIFAELGEISIARVELGMAQALARRLGDGGIVAEAAALLDALRSQRARGLE